MGRFIGSGAEGAVLIGMVGGGVAGGGAVLTLGLLLGWRARRALAAGEARTADSHPPPGEKEESRVALPDPPTPDDNGRA